MIAYLDHAATTQISKEVLEAMEKIHRDLYGNPSSLHRMGYHAEKELKNARKVFSKIIGSKDDEIVFTSGGTEANNLAILGSIKDKNSKMNHLITSQSEHPSVLNVFKYLETQGYEVTYLPIDKNGMVEEGDLEKALSDKTALVSLMFVNNEIGTIAPIENYGKIIKCKSEALFHVDGIQALGKIPCHVKKLNVDLMSFSGHKINGPKGVGCLYIKKGTPVKPLFYGGSQERGYRPGTENLASIVGFSEAAKEVSKNLRDHQIHLMNIKQRLVKGLEDIENCEIISPEEGAPHILNASFIGMRGEVLLHALENKNIYVSTGSACASKNKSYSHVLQALKLSDEKKEGAIRFSFSKSTTEAMIDYTIEVLKFELERLNTIINRR